MLTRLAIFSLSAAAAAQTAVIVPPGTATGDATSGFFAPGAVEDARAQLLIDGSLLPFGATVTALEFRRDASYDSEYDAGLADVQIVVSTSGRAPSDASPTFDDNHDANPSNRLTVYSGQLALPQSPSPSGRQVGWTQPQDVLSFPFLTPFTYTGGTLVIELVARRVAGSESRSWAIDGASDPAVGSVQRVGTSCNPNGTQADGYHSSANVSALDLVPGSSAKFLGRGEAGQAAAFLIGFVPLAVDLGPFGLAPMGCVLHVHPVVSMTGIFRGHARLPYGAFRVPIQMPTDPGTLGIPFRAQFLELGSTIYTSEALDCRLASSVPALGMSYVTARIEEAALPVSGRVWSGEAPVVRLVVR